MKLTKFHIFSQLTQLTDSPEQFETSHIATRVQHATYIECLPFHQVAIGFILLAEYTLYVGDKISGVGNALRKGYKKTLKCL